MTTIAYYTALIVIGAFFAVGVFNFLLIAVNAPSLRTTKTIRKLMLRQQSRKKHDHTEAEESIMQFIATFIRINPYKKTMLEEELKIAGIAKTPEVYIAGAVFAFLKYALIGLPILLIFPVASIPFFILAALKYAQEMQKTGDKIKAKRKQIELDLPRFVYMIAGEVKHHHDVVSILSRHKDSFSPEFAGELNITIADMRSGNYQAALQRFEGRIGSTNLSQVVRGLIAMAKGDDTHVYWETLAIQFSELQKQELRKEAQKVPGKVRKLSFWMLICLMLIYGVVLLYQIINNIGVLF
jgi:Flp pilus assembly protein TadB